MRNKLLKLERWGLWRHGDSVIRLSGLLAELLYARGWPSSRTITARPAREHPDRTAAGVAQIGRSVIPRQLKSIGAWDLDSTQSYKLVGWITADLASVRARGLVDRIARGLDCCRA